MSGADNVQGWNSLYRSVLDELGYAVYHTSDLHTLAECKGISIRSINSLMGVKLPKTHFWEQIADILPKKPQYLLYDAEENVILGFVKDIRSLIPSQVLCKYAVNEMTEEILRIHSDYHQYLAFAEGLRSGKREERALYDLNKRSFDIISLALQHLDEIDINAVRTIA